MGFMARIKSLAGARGGITASTALTAAATLRLPDHSNVFQISVTGGDTQSLSSLEATDILPGRLVILEVTSGTVNFQHTASPTTAGQMYLNGSNRAVTANETIVLYQRSDGTWRLLALAIAGIW